MSKCEVFSSHSLDLFPSGMISSDKPNLVILGAPIGNKKFCSSMGLKNVAGLWSQLEEVGLIDPQVALILLRLCGAFCKLVHLTHATPTSLINDALAVFDAGVRRTFCLCTGVDVSNDAWQQAQLSLGKGGLGLRSLSLHSPAAFIASVCSAGYGSHSTSHLSQAIDMFNCLVASSDVISVENLLSSCSVHQKALSEKLDDRQFNLLLNCSSVADRARLLSVSSPFAASWLSVIPSEGLGLHLTAPIFQVALKWWLGLDISGGSQCSLCPGSGLDHLSHHAVTCKHGGDVVTRHNRLCDCIVEVCRHAHIGVQVEVGNNLTPSHSKTRPADILIPNWVMCRTAALDVSVTSPLNPQTLLEAGVTATAAALTTEERKHDENDPKCSELGWVCIPVVAESYGAWGREATLLFSTIASRIATLSNKPKSVTLIDIYGRLNLQLVRANATSILARLMPPSY